MIRYAIQTEHVNRIFRLLTKIIGVRIVFYDPSDRKIEEFQVKSDSAYCRTLREDSAFDRLCVRCDEEHLAAARKKGSSLTYRCHAGLTEAIVPLFDESGAYIGAIVVGQIRQRGKTAPRALDTRLRRLYNALPEYDRREVGDITELLSYFADYIVQNHLIRHRRSSWAEILREYIDGHLGERLTLKRLASVVGLSPAFISHRFAAEFGLPPHRYIAEERMRRARRMLEQGCLVKEAAYELGFSDEFHFSRAFRAAHGVSPSRFGEDGLRA